MHTHRINNKILIKTLKKYFYLQLLAGERLAGFQYVRAKQWDSFVLLISKMARLYQIIVTALGGSSLSTCCGQTL